MSYLTKISQGSIGPKTSEQSTYPLRVLKFQKQVLNVTATNPKKCEHESAK